MAQDSAPLTFAQAGAVARAAGRELGWGLRAVHAEARGWQRLAAAIPDERLRTDVLLATEIKRPLTNGAAFLWTLTQRRDRELLRLLVAIQTLANILDVLSERDALTSGDRRGAWMPAISEALDIHRPLSSSAPWTTLEDGGHLERLVNFCRAGCRRLPSYADAHPLLVVEARRADVLDLEHDPDPSSRYTKLALCAAREYGTENELAWWELTAGACSLLTALVALVLASEPATRPEDIVQAVDAYRWIATLSAMLDNYVDHTEDSITGNNNYLGMYGSKEAAVQRIGAIVDRAMREASGLAHGNRHVVVVAAMIAMFLSSDSVRTLSSTRALVAAGGQTTSALMPALTAWRVVHRRRCG
jgi:tetraprenyl-beta-curcumene synthase